jgi:hypothetical protein
MTIGERWRVYPLLFLTLGIAVKDKLIKVVSTDNVVCKAVNTEKVICNLLVVTDPKGREQALISATPAGGILRVHGNGNNPTILLGHTEKLYGLIFADAKGNLVNPTIALPTQPPQRDPPAASPSADKPSPEAAPPDAPVEPAADTVPEEK